MRRKNYQLFVLIIVLLIGAVVYFSTVCHTVFIGDSGEFSLVFKTLGIAHPPGYPLFSLIGRIFMIATGFLKPAFSANILGVVLALGIAPILILLFYREKNPLLIGILSLLWLFSYGYWSQTGGIEVYALNLFLMVLISAIALSPFPKKWYLVSYFFGLALAHHTTIVILLPALIYIFLVEKAPRNLKLFFSFIFLFFVGISIYLYLPIRSSLFPLADWGHPAGFVPFLRHISGSQYHFATSVSWDNIWNSIILFLALLRENWWYMGFALPILGIALGLKYYFKPTIFLLLVILSNILLVSFYQIPDIDSYYLPALFATFILIGQIFIWLWKVFDKIVLKYLLVFLGLIATILLVVLNYAKLDNSKYILAEGYGKLILDSAEQGAVFCWDDISSFPALYLRYAEGYRPQIEVYDRATRLTALSAQLHASFGIETNDYQSARLSFCQQSLGDKHLVKCHYVYNEAWLNSPNKLYSNGILYSSIPPAKPITIPDIPLEYKINDFKTRQLLVNLALCQGEEYLLESPSDSLRAMVFFHKAMRLMESEPRAALHNQMGIFFRHFKFFDLALKCYANARNCPRLNKQEQKDLNFNISNIYKDKGNLSFAQGEYVNAVDNYSKALKYDPNNARLYYNIGVILIKNMHLPEKGLPYLKSYLKLNPSDAKTKEFINLYRKL